MITYKLPVASTLTYLIQSSSLPRFLIIDTFFVHSVHIWWSFLDHYNLDIRSQFFHSRWKRLRRCLSIKMIIFHPNMIVSRHCKFVIYINSVSYTNVIIILVCHEKSDVVIWSTRCHRDVRRLSSISLRITWRQSYQPSLISLCRVNLFFANETHCFWKSLMSIPCFSSSSSKCKLTLINFNFF